MFYCVFNFKFAKFYVTKMHYVLDRFKFSATTKNKQAKPVSQKINSSEDYIYFILLVFFGGNAVIE